MIRTTLSIQDETHKYLMIKAIQEKKTIGELVDALIANKNIFLDKNEASRKLSENRAYFAKLASKFSKTKDSTLLIREERDRDNE